MNILLDTCAFLWIISGSDKLSATGRELFREPENDVYLSAASCWEIGVKWSLGKLPLPEEPGHFIARQRKLHMIESLPITEDATFHLPKLPSHHNDPFDRILVCQAIEHALVILTPDSLINQYPVRTIW